MLTGKVSLVAPLSAAARRGCRAEALGDLKEKRRRGSDPLAFHLPRPGCYQDSAIYLAKFLAKPHFFMGGKKNPKHKINYILQE